MSKTIDEILPPKPVARPRIYAYSIADAVHKGRLKVGQTTRDVKRRVAEQVKTAAIKNYRIELDESAERDDGTLFSDHEVRAALVRKGLENVELEWMRCSLKDVQTALTELRTGQRFAGTHHETFPMRIALEDLKLERIAVVYPGKLRYQVARGVEAVPMSAIMEGMEGLFPEVER